MIEYRLAKGWRILTYIISPPMIVLFVYVMCLPFTGKPDLFYLLIPVSLAMISLFVYGVLDAWHGKVVLADDRITVKSPLGARMIMTGDVEGYKTDEHYFHLIPKDPTRKRLKISVYLGGSSEIREWLAERYDDLDQLHVFRERDEILSNEEFGITSAARARKLLEARKVAKVLNAASWVIVAWLFLYPHPYNVAIILGSLFPIVIMIVNFLYRGLMKADETKNSGLPSLATGFGLAIVAVMYRAAADFSILDYRNGVYLIFLLGVVLAFFYLLPTGGLNAKKPAAYFLMAVILMLTVLYSYSVCVISNCMLDKSQPMYHNPTVLEKVFTKGKTVTYYVKVTPWGEMKEIEQIKVSKEEYERVSVGDAVTVVQHAGALRMPWIDVDITD